MSEGYFELVIEQYDKNGKFKSLDRIRSDNLTNLLSQLPSVILQIQKRLNQKFYDELES